MKYFRVLLILLCLTVCLTSAALAEDETVTYGVLVYDEDLEPVEGMRFTISDGWEEYTFYTNAEGYAGIEMPVSWSYTLRAYPPVGYAINGEDQWELKPTGGFSLLMLEIPELFIPLTAADIPESPFEPVWGSYTDEWQDDEHGALAMSLSCWSDGTLSSFTERIGQVAYTFEFSGEEGGEVLSGYMIRQVSSDETVEARFDVYGNLLYAQAGDLQWSDHLGWFNWNDGPVALPEGTIDVADLGPVVITKPWPVPTNPDPNAPAILPQELPRVLSSDMKNEQLEITLNMRLYPAYGAYAPESGCALSVRFEMEDGSSVYATDGAIVAASEDEDIWICEVPEEAVDATVFLTYAEFLGYRYRSAGDGIWHLTFDEGDIWGDWTYAVDGTMAEAAYYYDEGYTIYDFTYEEGTNQLLRVWCAFSPNCSATFDGEGNIVSARCDDRMMGYIDWTPENGWIDSDGNTVEHECAKLGDPAMLICPIDLNAPHMEAGWYADSL